MNKIDLHAFWKLRHAFVTDRQAKARKLADTPDFEKSMKLSMMHLYRQEQIKATHEAMERQFRKETCPMFGEGL